jgi:hypothetical protein
MKLLAYISGIIGIISIVLAVIARLFLPYKMLFGMAALTYLRFTNTMLLFTIVFMLCHHLKEK